MKRYLPQATATLLLATMLVANAALLVMPGVAGAQYGPPLNPPDPATFTPIIPAPLPGAVPVASASDPNTAATAGATRSDFLQKVFEWLMRFVREKLRKMLLDMIVQQIIQWIQGGGDPKFITDWGGFLGDAANVALGEFAQEIGLGALCQPFSFQLRASLGLGVSGGGGFGFSQQISCTLDDIVGNIENFYDNFENGGWLAFQTMLEPQNNFYGAYLMAIDRRNSLVEARVSNAALEGLSGGGFLGTKDCAEAYGPWLPGQAPPDIDGDGAVGDVPSTCRITTPGQTIGALAAKAVGSDIDFIIEADELAAYIAAIADALINRLIGLGAQGLAGLFTSAEQGPGYNPPITASGCAGLTGPASGACQEYLNPSFSIASTTAGALAAPQNLIAVPASPNKVTIAWTDRAISETGYEIERSVGSPNAFTFLITKSANAFLHEDTSGVLPDTTYYYRVRAVSGTATSTYSNSDSATTITSQSGNTFLGGAPNPGPPPPGEIVATAGNGTTIVVAWTDRANAETGYEVKHAPYLSTNCAGANSVIVPASSPASFVYPAPSPGTNRYFCVRSLPDPANPDWVGPVSAVTPAF